MLSNPILLVTIESWITLPAQVEHMIEASARGRVFSCNQIERLPEHRRLPTAPNNCRDETAAAAIDV
jgi:hypothetical protein